MGQYMETLSNNQAYKEAASWWEGDFVFVVEPSGKLDHEIRLYIDLWHGDVRGGRVLEPGEEQKAEFIWSGTWDNYILILTKKVDPIQGLMQGKFKLVGNMAKIMRATKAAQEMVNSIVATDTQFY
jgi:putative sterol carrier protein